MSVNTLPGATSSKMPTDEAVDLLELRQGHDAGIQNQHVDRHAERADRDKPLNYEANSGECDDLKQVCVLVGDVVLVKGTIRATGQRVEIRKDPEGYARGLYDALHALESAGCDTIYLELPPRGPGWRAIHDRVRRATSA